VMIVSKYGFTDLAMPDGTSFAGTRGADPARIAAQVVGGISFLGAGVIFKNSGTVKGLTTAACLWITAAIGLAIGAGLLLLGFFTAVLVSVLQILLHRHAVGADAYTTNRLMFNVKNGHHFNEALTRQVEDWGASIAESRIVRHKDVTEYNITIRRRVELSYDEVKAFMDAHEEIISASNSPIR